MSSTGADRVLSEMISNQGEAYKTKLFEEVEHWLFVQGRSSATTHINSRRDHITEQRFPEQTKRFREILDEMYAVYLKKNADYSPYNILVTGMRGCVTRLWDKSARFFNLMGLDIGTYQWTEEKMNMVEDEDVNQTLVDWANYLIITRILREEKWGK